MSISSNSSERLEQLRSRAESVLANLGAQADAAAAVDFKSLIHEVQVYQVELEIQNEDLRQTQEALQASQDAYADLFDFAPVGYFWLNSKGTVLAANLTASEMLGVARDTLVRQPFTNFVTYDSQDLFYLHCQDILEFQQIQRCELQLIKFDGTFFDAQLEGLVIEDKEDGLQGIRLALLDITARKQAERATRERESQLRTTMRLLPHGILLLDNQRRLLFTNALAEDYLADLAEFQLGKRLYKIGNESLSNILARTADHKPIEIVLEPASTQDGPRIFEAQAQPVDLALDQWIILIDEVTEKRQEEHALRLQERLASVGQLAAGIAHDFNNILQVINSYSTLLLKDSDLSLRSKSQIEKIVKQGDQAAALIRQILVFSRTSYQNKKPIDIKVLLTETATIIKRTLPATIELTLDIHPAEAKFNASVDSSQLQQVLLNLAINSGYAMPDGGTLQFHLSDLMLEPTMRSPSPGMPSGKWIVLRVTDSGSGILPEHYDQIFEPFFTTKKVGEGSGLGLSQAHGIIQQHSGQILVESRIGKGASFTIYLPAMEEKGLAPQGATYLDCPVGDGELILLVEDDPSVLEIIKALIEHLEYRVVTARNGEEALAVYAKHHDIALVLTDISMPTMSGTDLAAALHKQNPTLNIVGLTGYPLTSDSETPFTQTIAVWLLKPVRIEKLAQIIHQFVR